MIQLPKLSLSSFSKQAIDIIDKYYTFSDSDDLLSSAVSRKDFDLSEPIRSWIAIEDFRDQRLRPPLPHVSKIFRSSGTTDAERAQSEFSELGMELYKFSALWGFSSMLKREGIAKPKLASAIPSQKEWPESSLAHMLMWFSEYWDFSYLAEKDFRTLSESNPERPLIFFITGFQLVHLLDSTPKLKLPSHFYLLETGGTKGKSRSISKEDLYSLVCERWGLRREQILSEYGMSELACQAYYADASREYFQFPEHVKLSVQTSIHGLSQEGTGNLIIHDPMRVDIPAAIRTQDVCQLKRSGEFKILGRAETAPLKGCSLRFEELISSGNPQESVRLTCREDITTQPVNTQLADYIFSAFRKFLHGAEIEKLLSEECQSNYLGKKIVSDLKTSIQNLDKDFDQALRTAAGGESIAKNWIIVPPSTHSVAAFYPTIFLLALGCRVKIRLPSNLRASETLLYFVDFMNQFAQGTLKTLPSEWRFEDSSSEDEAHLLFASNETIETVRSAVADKMVGFGSTLAFSVVEKPDDLERVFEDLFSLRRLGCLSSRSLFFHDSIPVNLIFETLNKWLEKVSLQPSDLEKAGMLSDSLRMLRSGWKVNEGRAICLAHTSLNKVKVNEALASSKFVIPAISYHNRGELMEWIEKECSRAQDSFFVFSGVNQEEVARSSLNVDYKSLGELNSFPWNGLHCGKPLLKINL